MSDPSSDTDYNMDPFVSPYEQPSGVPLNFNFWTKTNYLETEKDISNLIIALLAGDRLSCIRSNGLPQKPLKAILAIAQGVDSTIITSERIHSSSFFSQCSSVPINQQLRLG
jgi:hypothetical protein